MNLTRLPLNAAGSAPAGPEYVLSVGQVLDGQPNVSPDSKRIAYTSNRLGRNQIWIADIDGGRADDLNLPGSDVSTEGAHWWTPYGGRLLVLRTLVGEKASLWSTAADGSTAEQFLSPANMYNNAEGWPVAPNGLTVVYGAFVKGHSQLFEFEISTKRTRQLTFSSDDKFNAVFSPDGHWLTYASNANGSGQLWRIPSNGGQPEPLTTGNDRVRHMFYSHDGHWLYFQPNHLNIYRMPADGGQPTQQVTHFPESGLLIEEPTITPDGRYLVYCKRNGGSSLWVLRLGNTRTQAQ
jgi:Tol biopolymer transport system component